MNTMSTFFISFPPFLFLALLASLSLPTSPSLPLSLSLSLSLSLTLTHSLLHTQMQVVSVGSDKRLTLWEMRYSVSLPPPPPPPALSRFLAPCGMRHWELSEWQFSPSQCQQQQPSQCQAPRMARVRL